MAPQLADNAGWPIDLLAYIRAPDGADLEWLVRLYVNDDPLSHDTLNSVEAQHDHA